MENATPPPITLNEVLETIKDGMPFNLLFYKADKKRKQAGEKKELTQVKLLGTDWDNSIRRLERDNVITDVHVRLMLNYNGRRIVY